MTNPHSSLQFASSIAKRASVGLLVLTLSISSAGAMATYANATTTPKPSSIATATAKPPATARTAACQKVYKEIVNADNIYVATQYGVIAAAKTYLAAGTFVNKLAYNESFTTVFKAANAELNIAIKNPKCYPVAGLKSYVAGIKTNSVQIATIQNYNINGQIYYDPKKASVLKPAGLLK
jgi:hypothetical protein